MATSASSRTPFSSFKSPRPAPSVPTPSTRSDTPPLRRMVSEPYISQVGSRNRDVQLVYDRFANHYSRFLVRKGYVGVQRDKWRSWSWTRRMWLVLEDKRLHVCEKEGTEARATLVLNHVRHVERIETRRFCLLIATASQTWYLIFKDAISLHDWLYDIRIRCPLLRIGSPTDFRHEMHVVYDPAAGEITGLPEPWIETLASWGLGPDFNNAYEPDSSDIQSPVTDTAASPVTSSHASSSNATSPQSAREKEKAPSSRHQRSMSESTASHRVASSVPSIDHFRRSPHRFKDVDTRDLTGVVRTVHLLPTSRGEHCDIWKAEWSGPWGTRKVAIQVVRLVGAVAETQKEHLSSIIQCEAKALHQLRHPNIVRTRGLCLDQSPLPALVSTWMPRGNIMEYLRYRRPAVEAGPKLKLLAEVAAGLNYLHNFSRTILHGNLRGAYILINDNGSACLSGYGLNPVLQEIELPSLNPLLPESPGAGASSRWAAIEVIRHGRRHISRASDVFSFARTVLEVMTGIEPFHYIPDDTEAVQTILRGFPHRRPPAFGDDGLWPFLERCWKEEPQDRPSMTLTLMRMEEIWHLHEALPNVESDRKEPPNSAPPA